MCPALQKKPNLPSPRFEVETTASEAAVDNTKIDPFAPPYNPQLHVGDLKDELTEEEFVILVSFHEINPYISHLSAPLAEQIFCGSAPLSLGT